LCRFANRLSIFSWYPSNGGSQTFTSIS
jgi:hypothetical protein